MQRKSVGLFNKLVKQIKAEDEDIDGLMAEAQAIFDNADEVLANFDPLDCEVEELVLG